MLPEGRMTALAAVQSEDTAPPHSGRIRGRGVKAAGRLESFGRRRSRQGRSRFPPFRISGAGMAGSGWGTLLPHGGWNAGRAGPTGPGRRLMAFPGR